jgi:ribonuclease E
MVIRQRKDLTQIAVLEDNVLVEHYVARESQTSLIGNVYLGRVQNVLPSMEAAFVDIGKGRNAVLYAGEVNWDALGAGNGPRKIEQVLKSGQPILVQVTKDPIGHKGARLTSQVSLPGRFLVYVPDGTTSGISRKLPDTERTRLKTLLKEIVPDSAGVIVRTAAEGASEEELTKDVERLTARWSDIESKVQKGNAPQLLYGEPDLTLKVVRDLFTEDFGKLVVSGDDAWDMVDGYVEHVAPDLADRLERYSGDDVFADYRIDEQIAKGLDRKVWLPSGGSLIIDRTEAMTVVDVNTGKFTGSGGNLEETVTKNNLEAAEEMVRQLRLRDIGGIIVIDFIDMVLESNRDLVLRRLVECLGRDRTRHQVAEVTSLGLVQMTRKRIGTGLLEAFSETCEHCQGRGLLVSHEPIEPSRKQQEEEPRRGRRGRSRGRDDNAGNGSGGGNGANGKPASPSPKDIAAMARHEHRPPDETAGHADTQASDGAPVTDAPAPVPEQPADAPAPTPQQPTDEQAAAVTPQGTSPVETPAETPVSPATTEAAPADTPVEPPAETPAETPVEPPVPAGPRLVTTSRRRVARRPAGPPAGAASDGAAAVTPSDVPTEASDADGAASQTEPPSVDGDATETVHVPIKKKGSRKR